MFALISCAACGRIGVGHLHRDLANGLCSALDGLTQFMG